MSVKRIIPILVLLALVMSLAACQSNTADEAVGAANAGSITETDQTAKVENNAPAEADADAGFDQDDAVPPDVAAPDEAIVEDEATVPEFVPPQPAELATDSESVAFAMGNPDAPVQIVEFTDYQCPYCGRYALETMPAVVENLVESGRVFYAVKDLPLDAIHPEARAASVAARCAGEQDAYLSMHHELFATQADWHGTGPGTNAVFADLAADLALDVEAFEACMTDGRQAQNVQANLEEALSLGVTGTPTFFVAGYGVSGAQPYELFEMAVDLAESGQLDDVVEAQARQAYEAYMAREHGEEESGVELALNERYDQVRNGARLILDYDAQTNSFNGIVVNTTDTTLKSVRVEVHLSNGVELGPTTPTDLKPGESMDVTLAATSDGFDGWTAHPEVGEGGEHGGEGEHNEHGSG